MMMMMMVNLSCYHSMNPELSIAHFSKTRRCRSPTSCSSLRPLARQQDFRGTDAMPWLFCDKDGEYLFIHTGAAYAYVQIIHVSTTYLEESPDIKKWRDEISYRSMQTIAPSIFFLLGSMPSCSTNTDI